MLTGRNGKVIMYKPSASQPTNPAADTAYLVLNVKQWTIDITMEFDTGEQEYFENTTIQSVDSKTGLPKVDEKTGNPIYNPFYSLWNTQIPTSQQWSATCKGYLSPGDAGQKFLHTLLGVRTVGGELPLTATSNHKPMKLHLQSDDYTYDEQSHQMTGPTTHYYEGWAWLKSIDVITQGTATSTVEVSFLGDGTLSYDTPCNYRYLKLAGGQTFNGPPPTQR